MSAAIAPPDLAPSQRNGQSFSLRAFFRRRTFALALLLSVALLILSVALQPRMNWTNTLASFAPLAVAAIASTPAILSGRGGLDISIGPVMTLSSILYVGFLDPAGLGGYEAIPIVLLVCGAIGALNGLIIVGLNLQPVVVTLSTFFIISGVNLRIAPNPVVLTDATWVSKLASGYGWLPGGIVSIGVPVLIWFLITRTSFGRNLYSVGGNDTTAFSSGISVAPVRILAYALGGCFAGIGGLVLVGLVSSADSSGSSAYSLIAIAAVALGGTSLSGGRGGMTGAIFGALAIFLVQSVLSAARMPQTLLPVIYGGLLVVSVIIGALLSSKPKVKK
jgi:ribose transport system permease protein